ncbi:unnamed protein product [Calypogeia fissa]
MLSSLSGRQHTVYTGVTLVLPHARDPKSGQTPLTREFWEATKVQFAKLEQESIHAYVASGEPMGKAGAYGIQGTGGSFVKGINGCYFNVMGFPVHRFAEEVDTLIKAGYLESSWECGYLEGIFWVHGSLGRNGGRDSYVRLLGRFLVV